MWSSNANIMHKNIQTSNRQRNVCTVKHSSRTCSGAKQGRTSPRPWALEPCSHLRLFTPGGKQGTPKSKGRAWWKAFTRPTRVYSIYFWQISKMIYGYWVLIIWRYAVGVNTLSHTLFHLIPSLNITWRLDSRQSLPTIDFLKDTGISILNEVSWWLISWMSWIFIQKIIFKQKLGNQELRWHLRMFSPSRLVSQN